MSGIEVMLLRSTDTGAPVLSGTAGALIAVLDACLINGYNSKTPSSITRSGSTVTVAYATAHGYAADGLTKVLISGADQTEYNGIKQISNVLTLSFDFTVTGTPATPATGTITTKAAPVGWEKPFSGTNKAAYRSVEVTGTRLYLRVDDANPSADTGKTARVRGFEIMTDVDTGTGPFPTDAQLSGGLWLNKSDTASSAARPWILIGDGFEFHFFYIAYLSVSACRQFHFGDPASEMLSDPFGCLIYGDVASSLGYSQTNQSTYILSSALTAQSGHYYARAYSQIGGSIGACKFGNIGLSGSAIGASGFLTYPHQNNNGLYVSPIFISDTLTLRAQLKATYQPLHIVPLASGAVVSANISPIDRRLYSVFTAYGNTTTGETLLDIDGPWR